jgi:predicted aspartyl protease
VPTIHIQLAGEAELPDGRKVSLPAGQALQQRGPVVNVNIGLERNMAMGLLAAGQKVPAPIQALGLVDTGASSTCVDNDLALKLGLPVVDTVKMHSASHQEVEQPAYPISIEIIGTPIQFGVHKAMAAKLSSQGLGLLIGRDVLAMFTMFYNGITGQITLSI